MKISVGDQVIAEKTLDYKGDDEFFMEYFEIPAEVLAAALKTISVADDQGVETSYTVVTVKFESASVTEDSARLVGGLSMTKNFEKNAELTAVTSSNGDVRSEGDTFTVYLPAGTGSTKLKFDIADRYGLLYINDTLVNDGRKQEYLLTEDTTTLSLNVFAEDHETSKTYTVKILRGVDAPSNDTPRPDIPATPVPSPSVPGNVPTPVPSITPPSTPKPKTTVKKASISITAKKTVKKGKTITLKAKLKNVSGKVKWSVNKKKLAKITAKGANKAKLKALKKGKVKVTAKVKKVKKTITIKIK